MKKKLSLLIILIITLSFSFGCSKKLETVTSRENSKQASNLQFTNNSEEENQKTQN